MPLCEVGRRPDSPLRLGIFTDQYVTVLRAPYKDQNRTCPASNFREPSSDFQVGQMGETRQRQIGGDMHKQLAIAIVGATVFVLGAGGAIAQHKGAGGGANVNQGAGGVPPRASNTGTTSRSSTASQHGANKKGFCPPGQKKKPGKGSAFQC